MTNQTSGGEEKLPWTEERVEILKQLWAEGLSASQIAAKLAGGVTRNAVIGKVHRLGLSGRAAPARSPRPRARKPRQPSMPGRVRSQNEFPTSGNAALRTTPAPVRIERALVEPVPIKPADAPEGTRLSILMLSDKTCRWPIGDPGTEEFGFCGHTPKAGMPYCDYHAEVAYQPLHDRRRPRQAARG